MKRMATVLILFALLLSLPLKAGAAGSPLVVDEAGLLTAAQVRELTAASERISSDYGMDAVILTVTSLEGKSPRAFADDYYDSHGYGDDGLLLLIAIQDRDWHISTSGKAINVFTDYGLEKLGDAIVPSFSEGDFYEGFDLFLSKSAQYMESYERGEAVDVPKRSLGSVLLISALIGLAAAGVTVGVLCAGMNTKRRQQDALAYMIPDSYSLPVRQDIFLYSNVTKVKRPENNSSGKGGSTVHTSSSGRSHGGHGGKF